MPEHAYTTVARVRDLYRRGPDTPDSRYEEAIATATGMIDAFCGRRFDLADSEARVFPVEIEYLDDHPSMEIADIAADSAGDVTVEIAETPEATAEWTTLDSGWWLGPLVRDDGWPYTELYVRTDTGLRGSYLRITAEYGWDEVPAQIQRACL